MQIKHGAKLCASVAGTPARATTCHRTDAPTYKRGEMDVSVQRSKPSAGESRALTNAHKKTHREKLTSRCSNDDQRQ